MLRPLLLIPLRIHPAGSALRSSAAIPATFPAALPDPCSIPAPSLLPPLLQVGLLTLHTLPTRETYALVRTLQVGRVTASGPVSNVHVCMIVGQMDAATEGHQLSSQFDIHSHTTRPPTFPPFPPQVVLGSLSIVAGLAVGGSGLGGGLGWALGGVYEAARLLLVAAFILLHTRENIASP